MNMMDIDDGYYFWKRVDMVRPKTRSLKQIVDTAGLNYHLVKVQRSCNRIPKAMEAAKLAGALGISLEWLLTGERCDRNCTVRLSAEEEKTAASAQVVSLP